jgi:bifunctional DNA-binding transcriptional regulator/antitoxin component of YhaV-PrlF toxin-antitoxin module
MTELARSRVTSQEQTSVPVEVLRRYGIRSGCELAWSEEDGRLYVDIARTSTMEDIRAALKGRSTPKTDQEITDGIRAHIAEKFNAIR